MDVGMVDWPVNQEGEEVAQGLSLHLNRLCGLFEVH